MVIHTDLATALVRHHKGPHDGPVSSNADWAPVTALIDLVAADEELLRRVVASVRTLVRESAALTTADIVGHTRALVFAATRALGDRRGPTEPELSFVEDLAVTRARQGVPLEAVLGAVHVSERTIWARARELAPEAGVTAELLLDVRDLYDDWAEAVRSRLIAAHRAASGGAAQSQEDRDASILRRLLDGGSAAILAATEAGLPIDRRLWVVVGRADDAAGWRRALTPASPHVSAQVDGWFRAVVGVDPMSALGTPGARARTGSATEDAPPTAGVAGPVDPDELATALRLAVAAFRAALAVDRSGLVHVTDVPTLAALTDRPDLALTLVEQHEPAWRELGESAEPVARTVVAWLEADRDVARAAMVLFVHPNTVRNRVQRFTEVTGIDPATVFGAVDAWWWCTTWLTL